MLFLVPLAASLLVAPHEEKSFLSWMRNHNLLYTGSEYHFRLGVFLTNARYVSSFNAQKNSYKLGLNRFAAATPAEYRCLLSKAPAKIEYHEKTEIPRTLKDIPDTVDWREKGLCTPVGDQLDCAAGWAFAAVAAQEGQWKLRKNELMKLSEQDLLCCDFNDLGCDGGFADSAAWFVIQNQGGLWMLEEDYPYTGVYSRDCLFDEKKGVQMIRSVMYCKTANEADMKEKCAEKGVLAAAIDGSRLGFILYQTGVYDDEYCDRYNINHCVAIVGYGTLDGKDYWLCKNSFGTKWGEEGYIKMRRNAGGQCGIDLLPCIPLI